VHFVWNRIYRIIFIGFWGEIICCVNTLPSKEGDRRAQMILNTVSAGIGFKQDY
jgi:hypothetical protein